MPITINGSGTVTGITAGGLPDGVITTDDIAANAVTFAKIGTTEQGQLCKAWVNFNGTGTVAIRASYNVSSITDNGTGDYTVNFTAALADTNYVCIQSTANLNGNDGNFTARWQTFSQTTSSFRLQVNAVKEALQLADATHIHVAFFR